MIKYFIIASLVQIIWAFTPSASNIVIQEIPVELYIALRWSISGLIFLLVTIIFKKKIDLSLKMLPKYFLLGILGYVGSSLGTLYGLKLGGVVNFSLLNSVSPIVTALIAILILKEKVQKKYWFAIPLCISGLLIMVAGKHQLSGINIATSSALLILIAYCFEALPFVYSKKFESRQSLIAYMAVLQLSAASFMWVTQITYFKQLSSLNNISSNAIGAVFFVSIVSCVICYGVLYWLLRFIDGHKLAMFDGLHTVFGAIFGAIFFNESFNKTMLFGGILLLISIYLANSPNKKAKL